MQPLTPAQVADIVHAVFPGVEVLAVEPQEDQGPHQVLHLDLSNGLRTTLKRWEAQAEPHAAARETRLLRLVTSETGVPVPRLLHAELETLADGSASPRAAPWALLARLPGDPLSRLLSALDSGTVEAVGYETGRYLARLHAMSVGVFGALFAPGRHDDVAERGHFAARASAGLNACAASGHLTGGETDRIGDLIGGTELLDRREACLVIGGLRARDVAVERGAAEYHVTGFVDLSRAQGASPELDIAALFEADLRSPAAQKAFLDGYAEGGALDARFWDRMALYGLLFWLESIPLARDQEDAQRAEHCVRRIQALLDRLARSGSGNSQVVGSV